MQKLKNFLKELADKASFTFMSLMHKAEHCLKSLKMMTEKLITSFKSWFKDKHEPKDNVRIHYFVFLGGIEHQFGLLCRKGYKHVFVSEQLEHMLVTYNPTRFGMESYYLDINEPLLERIYSSDRDVTTIVRVVSRETSQNLLWPPQLLTCVRLVSYMSGLKFGICRQTPYSIYRYLTKVAQDEPNIISVKEITRREAKKWAIQ